MFGVEHQPDGLPPRQAHRPHHVAAVVAVAEIAAAGTIGVVGRLQGGLGVRYRVHPARRLAVLPSFEPGLPDAAQVDIDAHHTTAGFVCCAAALTASAAACISWKIPSDLASESNAS